MSNAKHTPGPWEAKPPRVGAAITIYAGDFPVVTTCSNTSTATMQAHRDGTVAANAHLIAAAPELLDALENLLKAANLFFDDNEGICSREQARAAIAKAKGGAQ